MKRSLIKSENKWLIYGKAFKLKSSQKIQIKICNIIWHLQYWEIAKYYLLSITEYVTKRLIQLGHLWQ
jgi:hypothetical protein